MYAFIHALNPTNARDTYFLTFFSENQLQSDFRSSSLQISTIHLLSIDAINGHVFFNAFSHSTVPLQEMQSLQIHQEDLQFSVSVFSLFPLHLAFPAPNA